MYPKKTELMFLAIILIEIKQKASRRTYRTVHRYQIFQDNEHNIYRAEGRRVRLDAVSKDRIVDPEAVNMDIIILMLSIEMSRE